jgi:PEP-CTERM motif
MAFRDIFGTRYRRVKYSRRVNVPSRFRTPSRRNTRWKRSATLALLLIGLFLGALAEHGGSAISKVIRRTMVAALADPLNLLDERSPGGRGARVLLSIKGPHERVLPSVRDRQPPLGVPPGVGNPLSDLVPESFAPLPNDFPADLPATLPQDQVGGSPSFAPFFPALLGNPGSAPGGATTPNPPPPITSTPLPNNPITIVIPEPATWTMMLLGFLVIGAAARRRARRST